MVRKNKSLISLLSLTVVVFILFSATGFAEETDPSKYAELTLKETITNTLEILPTASDYSISKIEANFLTVPKISYRQEKAQIETSPEAKIEDDKIRFTWTNPQTTNFKAQVQATLKTKGTLLKISQKNTFPIKSLPTEINKYLDLTKTIDTNDDIRILASSLAGNEDDLYTIEVRIAEWVNQNIKYDLSTLTSQANEPATWVLENKYGVCDEITNLFIALNRALGIPARFVSGIAYTDSELFSENWGNHGWAEVYFPSVGWVPFDVTYRQYGYVDATHIALQKGIDGSESSVEYSSTGRNIVLKPQKLEFSTELLSEGKPLIERTEISLKALKNNVYYGSYNLIIATVKNNNNYYVTEGLTLSKTTNLKVLSEQTQVIALKPRETKKIYWLTRVDENLDKDYSYSFPVSVSRTIGEGAETTFTVDNNGEKYDKDYMEASMEMENHLLNELPLECDLKSQYLIGDTSAQVICSLIEDKERTKEISLPLKICAEKTCETIGGLDDTVSFPLDTTEVGVRILRLTASATGASVFERYSVKDKAELIIKELSLPETFSYDEEGILKIVLEKKSFSQPKDIKIILDHPLFQEEWGFDSLDSTKEIDIQLSGSTLLKGNNEFLVTVEYDDGLGTRERVSKTTETNLEGLTFAQTLQVSMNSVNGRATKFITSEVYHATTAEEKELARKNFNTISIIVFAIFSFMLLARILRRRAR